MAETEQALDHIIGIDSLRGNESQLAARMANLIGRRTLAVVEADASFDPDMYDPALDEADFEQLAA
jgi:hypothetical protein